MTTDSKISAKSEKEVKTWRQSTEKNGVTKSVNVEKLYNTGFLVTVNKYGNDSRGKYFDTTFKLYSDTNPLEEVQVEDPMDVIFKTIIGDKR